MTTTPRLDPFEGHHAPNSSCKCLSNTLWAPSCKQPPSAVCRRNGAFEGRRRGEKVEEAAAATGRSKGSGGALGIGGGSADGSPERMGEGAGGGARAWRFQIRWLVRFTRMIGLSSARERAHQIPSARCSFPQRAEPCLPRAEL